MKIILSVLVAIHGAIHLIGFAKAFGYAKDVPITQSISGAVGVVWLLSSLCFIATALLIVVSNEYWWVAGTLAVVSSQSLIFSTWNDTSFGTIANIIIVVAIALAFGSWHFRRLYETDVKQQLEVHTTVTNDILTEQDIGFLPEPVKKYIRYTGSIGKPKVRNFRIDFEGKIRSEDKTPWMPFQSEQHNFLQQSLRLFFLHAEMKRLPVTGYHRYKNGEAFMDIRLLSLIKVQYQDGEEMGVAETVTFFNDMCVMAPATLIDHRITWNEVVGNKVLATFTTNGISISAWLHFNEEGQLINFVSEDRHALMPDGTMQKYRWSTPVKDYADYNGIKLASFAEAVYDYPEGPFVYGQFHLQQVIYNQ